MLCCSARCVAVIARAIVSAEVSQGWERVTGQTAGWSLAALCGYCHLPQLQALQVPPNCFLLLETSKRLKSIQTQIRFYLHCSSVFMAKSFKKIWRIIACNIRIFMCPKLYGKCHTKSWSSFSCCTELQYAITCMIRYSVSTINIVVQFTAIQICSLRTFVARGERVKY